MSRQGYYYEDPKTGLWAVKGDVAPRGAPRKQIHKRGFKRKGDEVAYWHEVSGNVAHGTHVNPSTVTLAEWCETWCAGLPAAGYRRATVNSYRDVLDGLVVPRIGEARLQALTAADQNKLYSGLLAEGRRGRPLSARTVRYVHVVLGKCLSDAVRQGVLARNPADLATPPRSSSTKPPEHQVWSPAETAEFLRFVEAEGDRLAALYRVAAMSGMRRGELAGLKWGDLNGSQLSVRRQVTVANNERPRVADLKTDRARRSIDLDDETVARLRTHRREQSEERLALGLGGRSEFMFTELDGSLLDPRNVTRRFGAAVKASGLPRRVKFHSLRHGHASHMLAAGVSVKLVSDRLGHANPALTLSVYSHVIGSQGADAAAAVAALVDGSS
jgi:integrase